MHCVVFQVKELSPSPLSTLRQRLGLPTVAVAPLVIDSITSDEELLALGQNLLSAEGLSPTKDKAAIVKVGASDGQLILGVCRMDKPNGNKVHFRI